MCYCANSDKWTPDGANAKPAKSGTTCSAGGLIGLGLLRPDWTVTWNSPGTWQHQGCLSGASLTGGPTMGVATTEQCFSTCQRYKYAAITFTGTSTMGCTCGTILSGGTPVACGTTGTWSNSVARRALEPYARRGLDSGAATVFANNAPEISAVSQQRRALEAQLRAEAAARDHAYCPEGFTGCLIPGSTQYECIDTRIELGE